MKISVVISAHNDVATLSTAIRSVLEQSHQAEEVIVVDNGSKDASSEVAKNFDEVSLLRQKEMGRFSAWNNGAMMAEHGWIAFLDAKEHWDVQKLKMHVAFHKKNPDAKATVFTDKGVMALKEAMTEGRINTSQVVVEKKLFESEGGFDESFEISEDEELWMRVVEALL